MGAFDVLAEYKHEELVHCYDDVTGLRAWVAVHDTALGPALGGTRMWDYAAEEDAVVDVLRLSRGMTFKASIAGLNLGGGKAVIVGDARTLKSPELMRRFGKFVESLQGRYITAEDVNMSEKDMAYIAEETSHVTGISEEKGGNGDPSPVTAYTTFLGLKASAEVAFGSNDLSDRSVLVQGAGHVGTYLIEHLIEAGARVSISDIFEDKIKAIQDRFDVEVVDPSDVTTADVDIYAPCALGGTINSESISSLKCKVIAGAANNQLLNESVHGPEYMKKGIVYAPDFLINSGGLINVYCEHIGEPKEDALKRAEYVYGKTKEILERSLDTGEDAQVIATKMAQERIDNAK